MSLKCGGQELFVGKTESNIISMFGSKKKINYSDIYKIEYCLFKFGSGGGYLDYYKNDGKLIRFEFNYKLNDKINDVIKLISENNPDLEIIEKNAHDFKFYQRDWFIILMLFMCCMPLGLFLMWYYKKLNKVAMALITSFFVIFWFFNIYFMYANYQYKVEEINNALNQITSISDVNSISNETFKSTQNENTETEVYKTTLYTGHYLVGTDIPSGTYTFSSKKGSGNLFSSDGKINSIFDHNKESGKEIGIEDFGTEELNNIYLEEGVILSVSGCQQISAGCSDGLVSGMESRNQEDLKEVEIGYGNFGASDNIPAGTYDVELIEGKGNIICGTDMSNGINEIMGQATAGDKMEEGMYITKFRNLIINEGDILEINDIKIKLIPSK